MEIQVVLVTVPDQASARELARKTVESGLAACVNIIPSVLSVYTWKGAVQEDTECMLMLKSTTAARSALEALVLSLHPYETPEFIVLSPQAISERYQAWILDYVSPPAGE